MFQRNFLQHSHRETLKEKRSLRRQNPVHRFAAGLLLVIVLVSAASTGYAELASKEEMRQVCENWLTTAVYQQGAWAGELEPQILMSHDIYSGDTLLATWYDISPKGFVVVPVLKEMQPVKAYSDEYNLDNAQEGGFLALLREMLSQRMNYYAVHFGSTDAVQPTDEPLFGPEQRARWDKYTLSSKEFTRNLPNIAQQAVSEAGPLLTSSWHQRPPYNNLCPMGDTGRVYVGCVATAFSQILNYWQWPSSGTGSHSYYWGGDSSCGGSTPGEILSADYSDSYDWANMLDSCDEGCTPEQEAAVAELCYEAGVAVDMAYGHCGSGAYLEPVALALYQYLKYDGNITHHHRTSYDLNGWFTLMQTEIDAGRPVNYGIYTHAIVLDGYRTDGFSYEYHMNYGWGDAFNTWFVLDNLYCGDPDNHCPVVFDEMYTNIKPQTEPHLSILGQSVDDSGGNGNFRPEIGETVDLWSTIKNGGATALNVTGQLTTSDPYVSIGTADVAFADSLPRDGQCQSQSPYVFTVNPDCPDPHVAELILNVAADGGYSTVDTCYQFIGNTSGFYDDIEAGQGLWIHKKGHPQYADEWHLETSRTHSGSTAWKAGGDGANYYANFSDGWLVTLPFLLPENGPVLTFWHWFNIRQMNDYGDDGAAVYISSGDGQWTQLIPTDGYPYAMSSYTSWNPLDPGTPCYSGAQDWSQATFDLSAYSGVVQLGFRLASNLWRTSEGWYIDDVSVEGTGCCGVYTGGLTGNTDCSTDGLSTLSDITRLIDRVYLSHDPLCCEENGNLDGSADGELTLADVTALIDFVYISHNPPVACP